VSEYIPTGRKKGGLRKKERQTDRQASTHKRLDVHEFVHRDTTMKITNKMHYID
jgi:hypothetical protein